MQYFYTGEHPDFCVTKKNSSIYDATERIINMGKSYFATIVLFVLMGNAFGQIAVPANGCVQENFDAAQVWTFGGFSSSWTYGNPNKTTITDDITGGGNCLILGGNTPGSAYNANEDSWAESPEYDLSAVNSPYIEFWFYYSNEPSASFDEIWMEYSLNNGATWSILSPPQSTNNCYDQNWYNYADNWGGNTFTANPPGCTFGGVLGGGPTGWELVRKCVANDIANEPSVRFRFRIDAGSGCQFEGATIDNFTVCDADMEADFDFACTGNPLEVSFTDLSEECPDDWLWDFGDGNTSTAQNPTHTYATGGSYNVTLTSTASVAVTAGCGGPFTDNITINVTLPSAGTNGAITLCSAQAPTDLFNELGGAPDNGGTWSGPSALGGGDQGTFDPATMTAGTYTYTVGTAPCQATADVVVTIDNPDAGTNGNLSIPCGPATEDLYVWLGGTPDYPGVWTGPSPISPADPDGNFDPHTMLEGVYTYTVGTAPCTATATVTVDITGNDPGTNGSITLCDTDPSTDLFNELGGTPDAGGTWSPVLTSGTGVFDPAIDADGTYTYTVGSGGCAQTADVTVTVNPCVTNPGCPTEITFTEVIAGNCVVDQDGGLFGGDEDPSIALYCDATLANMIYAAEWVVNVNAAGTYGLPGAPWGACGVTNTLYMGIPSGNILPTFVETFESDNGTCGGLVGSTACGNSQNWSLDLSVGTHTITNGEVSFTYVVSEIPVINNITVGNINCTGGGLYDAELIIDYTPPAPICGQPYVLGDLDVNGTTFTAAPSPMTITLTGLPVNTPTDVTAFFNGDYSDCDYFAAALLNQTIPDPGTNGNATACNSGPSIDLFNSLGGTPANGGTWAGPSALGGGDLGTFDPLTMTPGTYTYTVGTAPCDASADVTVTIDGPTIDGTILTDPTCGFFNGEIDITASGGTAPLSYSVDNGTTFQGGTNFPGLLAGNYDIIVEDASGCQATTTVTLTNTAGPSITTSTGIDPTCGATNGQIDITATGGTAPLNYSIDNGATFQTGNTFTGLADGTYDIVVEDASGCQVTDVVVLNPGAGPTIDATALTDPSCGTANGVIDITASGGTAPLNYSIDNGATFQTGNSFTGLADGTYDIVVEDANGCQATQTETITDPGAPTIDNVVTTDPNCGLPDGEIDITTSGGTAPLQYSIDNGTTFQGTGLFTALASGSYDIVVEDANGCQVTQTVSLSNAGGPSITSSTGTDPNCGNNDGIIDIVATGGTAPLQYSIDGGATFQPGANFTGLGGGTYNIVVEDAGGCQATDNVILNDPGAPTITNTTVTEPTCGLSNGEIDITVTGGGAPYLFSTDNGASFSPTAPVTGLPAGTYDVVVQDANGCVTTATVVTLTDPGPPVINSTTVTDPLCFGGTDGEVDINATGGTAPLEYSIDNGTTYQPGNIFTGLSAGNYNIVVQDANGCQVPGIITVVNPVEIVLNPVATEPSCGNSNGEINLNVTGGVAPLQFSNDGGTTFQGTSIFTNLGPGTYDIVVEDANGCTEAISITLTNQAAPTISSTPTTDASCGLANGSIQINTTGGANPLSYSIDAGATTQPNNTFNNVGPGTYDLQVIDANGCITTGTVTINDQPAPVIDSVLVTNPLCEGTADGTAEVFVSGGVLPIEYSIDGGATFQFASDFSGIPAGNYNIVIQDANGCQVDTIVNLIDPLPVVLTPMPDTLVTLGEEFQLWAIPGGGTAPYSFEWSCQDQFDCYLNSPTDSMPYVNPLSTDFYYVTVVDANGCSAEAAILVEVDDNISLFVPNIFSPDNNGINDILYVEGAIGFRNFYFAVYNRWGELVFDSKDPDDGWDGTHRNERVAEGVFVYVLTAIDRQGRPVEESGNITVVWQ